MTTATSTTSKPLPLYQCFKQVHALRIKSIAHQDHNEFELPVPTLEFEESDYAPIQITRAAFNKHQPQPGWYYVVYPDGYQSFSPPQAFEEGYCRIDDQRPASPMRAMHLAQRSAEAVLTLSNAMYSERVRLLEMELAEANRYRDRVTHLLSGMAVLTRQVLDADPTTVG